MCRVGFLAGILSVIAYASYEYLFVVPYDYRFVFMIPLLVSGLGFIVFGIAAAAGPVAVDLMNL